MIKELKNPNEAERQNKALCKTIQWIARAALVMVAFTALNLILTVAGFFGG